MSAANCCTACGQPLPQPERRDPPLPPLPTPALVTIHDLPESERARAKVECTNGTFKLAKVAK